MGTVILLLMFPIGIITYYWDKKVYAQSLETFEEYIVKIKHSDLSDEEKVKKIDHMFYENSYAIMKRDETSLVVARKHFNIGILFMVFGLFNYFGAIGYIVFYKFFLIPRTFRVDVNSEEVFTNRNFKQ